MHSKDISACCKNAYCLLCAKDDFQAVFVTDSFAYSRGPEPNPDLWSWLAAPVIFGCPVFSQPRPRNPPITKSRGKPSEMGEHFPLLTKIQNGRLNTT